MFFSSENALKMATSSPFRIATKKLLAGNGRARSIVSKSGAGNCTWNLDGMAARCMSTLKGSSPGIRKKFRMINDYVQSSHSVKLLEDSRGDLVKVEEVEHPLFL